MSKQKKKADRLASKKKVSEAKEEVEDKDVAVYLIIGVSLGLVCILGLGVCSVVTCLQRRRRSSKFSDTNAAIHSKYQDTSLQITGRQQDRSLDWSAEEGKGPADNSTESGVHETSFSVSPTDHSFDGLDDSSQGSTALAQVWS